MLVFILMVGFVFGGASLANAEEALQPAECSEFYVFGNVEVDIRPQVDKVVSGSQARFYLTVTNKNNFPIVDGSVYIKIAQKQTDLEQAQSNGGFIIDQFLVKEGIALDANEVKEYDFLWSVPLWSPSGNYTAYTYFQSAKKFDLLGLSFSDDVVGGGTSFSIESDLSKSVWLDKNNAELNGVEYNFAAPPPILGSEKPVTAKILLKNPTNAKQETTVTYRLYQWSGLLDSQKIDTEQETISLTAGQTKTLKYEVTNTEYPVYYLEVESKWNDFTSILDMRFARQGVSRPRLNFVGVNSFPFSGVDQNGVFACIHNASVEPITQGKLELVILDEAGSPLETFTYTGDILGNLTGFKGVINDELDNFSIKASLYDTNNKLVDTVQMAYKCDDINPEKCLSGEEGLPTPGILDGKYMIYILIGVGVVIIAGTILIILKKKSGGGNGSSLGRVDSISPDKPLNSDGIASSRESTSVGDSIQNNT